MKKIFLSLVTFLGLNYSAQAVSIGFLPAGTIVTVNQKLVYEIGATAATVGSVQYRRYSDTFTAYCSLVVKPESVRTGRVLNAPTVVEVSSVSKNDKPTYGDHIVIEGNSNKWAFSKIHCSEAVNTIERFVELIEKAGGSVQLPAVVEE